VNRLQIDLLSLSVLGIFALLCVIAAILLKSLRPSEVKGSTPPIEDDILEEVKRLRQDIIPRLQATSSIDAFLEEIRKVRLELESRFQELEKLRQDFESRFGAKFSKQGFTADDAYPFFLAVSNSLNRFDRDRESGVGSNLITEAKGYVAILRLILSWAQANGDDGVKRKAEEFLEAAESTLERASHL